jgi:tRNA uridine 5-carbamoylmethylation protein Kti12
MPDGYKYSDRLRVPTLHIMVGIPRSGKSTMVKALVSNAQVPTTIVCRDDLRRVCGHRYFEPINCLVKAVSQMSIEAALIRGIDVFCDETHITKVSRAELVAIAKRCDAHFTFVTTDCNKDELVRRAKETDFPLDVLEKFLEDYEPVTEEEVNEYNN